jgi:hypothetical protein
MIFKETVQQIWSKHLLEIHGGGGLLDSIQQYLKARVCGEMTGGEQVGNGRHFWEVKS